MIDQSKHSHHRLVAGAIKQRICPSEFYSRELGIKLVGNTGAWKLAGLCPFHSDGRAGSFHINVESGSYVCFSCGAKGSDIISYVQNTSGKSFREALMYLDQEWGNQNAY